MEMRVGEGPRRGLWPRMSRARRGWGGRGVMEIMAFQAEGTACAKQGVRVDLGG